MSIKNYKVIVIDYGLGNLFSVMSMLNYLSAEARISSIKEEILSADKLILPGVGSFGDGMNNLKQRGLIDVINKYVETGKPLLGICLGMQLLMSQGEEFGTYQGLGIIKGKVLPMEIEESKKSIIKYRISAGIILFYRNTADKIIIIGMGQF